MSLEVIFSHGKESGPMGTKITALIGICDDLGVLSQSVDYRGMDDPEQRAALLTETIANCRGNVLLVGSSMGSYVSLRASDNHAVLGLFLMAPAVYMPGYDSDAIDPKTKKTFVVHGWSDEIVPVVNAIKFAETYAKELLLVDDDHVLRNSLNRLCLEFRRFLASFITPVTDA